jgi:hypothetical protein
MLPTFLRHMLPPSSGLKMESVQTSKTLTTRAHVTSQEQNSHRYWYIVKCISDYVSRDSIDGIATSYGQDERGVGVGVPVG